MAWLQLIELELSNDIWAHHIPLHSYWQLFFYRSRTFSGDPAKLSFPQFFIDFFPSSCFY